MTLLEWLCSKAGRMAFIVTNKSCLAPQSQLWCSCSSYTLSHSLRRHLLWSHGAFKAHNESSLRSSAAWISDNSPAFVVVSSSWMCASSSHLPSLFSPPPHVSSRLGMIYWMDPTLSPLIKPASSQESRLRSSSDPTWSTSTSPDSWSKLSSSARYCTLKPTLTISLQGVLCFLPCSQLHICCGYLLLQCRLFLQGFPLVESSGVMSAVTTVFWFVGSRARMTSYVEVC